ncbi:hypothetical protein [Aquicella lusitana]|uniref:Uncharacterized protein n=1 Tax=Aquicella lusitana TaxID=254246 RepID=A0A370GWM8_9COXI|nr:hypothetical protein [Aquicella lusitana]RDI48062.1 hypothetical protein C8D86_10327 [Aquicella lusitana]VVC72922.1 hypothetical protein AQULUS_06460 [Aquicella lusitana]
MISRQEKILAGWGKYRQSLPSHITRANNALKRHSTIIALRKDPSVYPEDFEEARNILTKLYKINDDLVFFQKKFQALELNSQQIRGTVYELANNQLAVLSCLIELNKILADNHMYQWEKFKKNKKLEPISKAHQYAQEAWRIWNENPYLENNRDDALKNFVSHVEDRYNSCVNPDKAKSGTKLERLLTEARNIQNKERAFKKFDEALEEAKASSDLIAQFKILWEQGRDYTDCLHNSLRENASASEINHVQSIVDKLVDCYTRALNIIRQIENANKNKTVIDYSSGICIDLIFFTKLYLTMASFPSIANDQAKKEELVRNAMTAQQTGNEFANVCRENHEDYALLKQEIEQKSQHLEKESAERIAEKEEKEKEQRAKHQLQEEYDLKFEELLQSFPEQIKPKKVNHHDSTATIPSSEDKIPEEDDEAMLYIQDEGPLASLVYVNFKTQPPPPPPPCIYFKSEETYLHQLKMANEAGDIFGQIQAYTDAAEYYRARAENDLKHHSRQLESAISNLEAAKNYLLEATQLLQQARQNLQFDQNSLAPFEKATKLVLENTEALLTKTIQQQIRKCERLNRIHDEVKAYIIKKYGKAAWFKHTTFDWDTLSSKAKIRLSSQSQLGQLQYLDFEVHQLIGCLRPPLLNPSNVPASLPPHPENSLPVSTDFQLTRQVTRAHIKYSFFNQEGQRIGPLVRSLSHESFFEPADIAIRNEERKGYGRQ